MKIKWDAMTAKFQSETVSFPRSCAIWSCTKKTKTNQFHALAEKTNWVFPRSDVAIPWNTSAWEMCFSSVCLLKRIINFNLFAYESCFVAALSLGRCLNHCDSRLLCGLFLYNNFIEVTFYCAASCPYLYE